MKTIQIRFDYATDGFWGYDEEVEAWTPLDREELPELSDDLWKAVSDWNMEAEVESIDNKWYFETREQLKEWSNRGAILAQKVQDYLTPNVYVRYVNTYVNLMDIHEDLKLEGAQCGN